MKFSGESEILGLTIDSLMSWNNGDHMLIEGSGGHKVIIGGGGSGGGGEEDDGDSKGPMDDLDLLLTSTQQQQQQQQEPNNNSLAELKPLPPFTGYTGHLSINGISGHHYHTIAAAPSPPRVEANNNSSEAANQNVYYTADQVVSSSTMDCTLENIKTEVGVEDYQTLLAPDIEDIAAIIGSAIADTTVQGANNNNSNSQNNQSSNHSNGETSRDSWMDIDAWIDTACSQSSKTTVISAESLQELVASAQFGVAAGLAYQQQHIKREPAASSYMPLLQGRLQNGPPSGGGPPPTSAMDCPSPSSSTPYLVAHSPPGHVVSTSDLVRYNPVHSSRPSPELQVGYPHTTTPGCKKTKSKSKSKAAPATSTVLYTDTGLGGKEKPVHRCTICNRGFLNKSNIKVHLRTHTGEKPFRCDVCGKAFRQKAHLIKHAQIHKRIGRD